MKFLPATALCLTLLTLGALAAEQPVTTNEIAQLETAWNAAHLSGDADAVDKLCAEDLVVTVPAMAVMGKKAAVGALRSGRVKFTRYESSETRIQLYEGHTAVVTGRLQRTRKMGDKTLEDDWRFTKVFARLAGKWQVIAFHAMPNAQ